MPEVYRRYAGTPRSQHALPWLFSRRTNLQTTLNPRQKQRGRPHEPPESYNGYTGYTSYMCCIGYIAWAVGRRATPKGFPDRIRELNK